MKRSPFGDEQRRYFGGGGAPSVPASPPIEPTPKEQDKAVQQAAADALRRKQMQRGYRSTILGSMLDSGGFGGKTTLGS